MKLEQYLQHNNCVDCKVSKRYPGGCYDILFCPLLEKDIKYFVFGDIGEPIRDDCPIKEYRRKD